MKKSILMVVAGFLMLIFFNGVCCCDGGPNIYNVYSNIELSGLKYDKVKIEFSEFSENISQFDASLRLRGLTGITINNITINNKKITNIKKNHYDGSIDDNIKAKKPIIIKAPTKSFDHLYLDFKGFDYPFGSPHSYRLKVDTEGLKVNKNLFDKKITFTPEGFGISILINILNKKVKVDIKY